jgi:hypothetical protein
MVPPLLCAGGKSVPLSVAVHEHLFDTCPDGNFQIDASTGEVTPKFSIFCQQPPPGPPYLSADVSSTPVCCGCICDVIRNSQTATIKFLDHDPSAAPSSGTGGMGGVPTDADIYIDPRFEGQYLIKGKWVSVPFYLIFVHELCGHGLPYMLGTHSPFGPAPPGGTPPQEQHAVDVERQVPAEHKLPRRPEDYLGGARERPNLMNYDP